MRRLENLRFVHAFIHRLRQGSCPGFRHLPLWHHPGDRRILDLGAPGPRGSAARDLCGARPTRRRCCCTWSISP